MAYTRIARLGSARFSTHEAACVPPAATPPQAKSPRVAQATFFHSSQVPKKTGPRPRRPMGYTGMLLVSGIAVALLSLPPAVALGSSLRSQTSLMGLQEVNVPLQLDPFPPPGEANSLGAACAFTAWETKEQCDDTLPVIKYTRTVQAGPVTCGPTEKTEQCVPTQCLVSAWSTWEPCLANGKKARTREVIRQPQFGGRECPHLKDEVQCCQKDCFVSEWNAWACNATTHKKDRSRVVVKEVQLDGDACPHLVESVISDECENRGDEEVESPDVECIFGESSDWETCEEGAMYKTRKHRYVNCPDGVEELDICDPRDCKLSTTEYENWSECDESKGTKYRFPKKVYGPIGTGKECDFEGAKQEIECDVDCQLSDTEYDDTDAVCEEDKDRLMKYWKIIKPKKNNGKCERERVLTNVLCPDDCVRAGKDDDVDRYPFVATGNYALRKMTRLIDLKTPAPNGGSCPAVLQTRGCTFEEFWAAAKVDPELNNKYVMMDSSSHALTLGSELSTSQISLFFQDGSVTAYAGDNKIGSSMDRENDKFTFTGEDCWVSGGKKSLKITLRCSNSGWFFFYERDSSQCDWEMVMTLPGPCPPLQ